MLSVYAKRYATTVTTVTVTTYPDKEVTTTTTTTTPNKDVSVCIIINYCITSLDYIDTQWKRQENVQSAIAADLQKFLDISFLNSSQGTQDTAADAKLEKLKAAEEKIDAINRTAAAFLLLDSNWRSRFPAAFKKLKDSILYILYEVTDNIDYLEAQQSRSRPPPLV